MKRDIQISDKTKYTRKELCVTKTLQNEDLQSCINTSDRQ